MPVYALWFFCRHTAMQAEAGNFEDSIINMCKIIPIHMLKPDFK